MENFTYLEDDGLYTPEIGLWGVEKYKLVSHYASMFARSMRGKWDCIVYLDLYSGAGRSRLRENRKIINAPPMLLLEQDCKFSKYIFNDSLQENCLALQARIEKLYPDVDVAVFCEDTNQGIGKITSSMPRPHRGFRMLSFCFLDPFKMDNLKFSTVKFLSQRYMDFLVLIPSDMDANRNEDNYLRSENKTVEEFLGNPDWRGQWEAKRDSRTTFGQFIVEEFGQSMGKLGYRVPPIEKTAAIKNSKNRVIYRLALYSKSALGEKFWTETQKYTNPQIGFPNF